MASAKPGLLGQFLHGAGSLVALPFNVANAYATGYAQLPQQYRDAAELRRIKVEEAKAMAPLRQQAVTGLFGALAGGQLPSAPADAGAVPSAAAPPAPRSIPSIRDLASPLARAALAGYDVTDLVNVLDKTAPQIDVANGVAYDKRGTAPGSRVGVNLTNVNGALVDPNDPKNVDRYVPKLPDGAVPLYDAQGNVVATRMLDGVIQAVGATAGAEAGARKAAESPYNFLNVPQSDGTTKMMSQDQLVRGLLPPGGQTGGPVLGVTQRPGDRIREEGAARREVDVAASRPKAEAAMTTMNRGTDQVLAEIDRALGKVSNLSAGMGSLTGFIPSSPAKNLDSILDTIRANVGFDRLDEMRANSQTGGALGSITERELALLASVAGSLNQGQSPDQLRTNLGNIKSSLSRVRAERMAAFNNQYGDGGEQSGTSTGGYTRAQLEAEARRRGILR